jgi:hypothetical protein
VAVAVIVVEVATGGLAKVDGFGVGGVVSAASITVSVAAEVVALPCGLVAVAVYDP